MYKKIEIKKGISSFYINEKYVKYVQKSLEGKIKVENHLKEVIFTSEQNWINRSCLVGDNLCYSSYDEDFTRIQKLDDSKSIILDVLLSDITSDTPNIYNNLYYNLSEIDNNCIYDLVIGKEVGKCKNEIKGFIKLNTEDYILTKKETFIYNYSKTDFTLLWQKDLSEQTQYTEWDGTEEKGKIREVYEYQDSVIVLTQMFILRIDLQTGDIIYSLQLPAGLMELSIVGDKAYGCYGYHYMEVDIEKGKLLKFIRIENAVYQGKEYNAIMDSPKFHEGYVFHGVRLEGGYYAISALDAQTGKRMWIDLLGTYMVEKIEFYENKMFVSDSGGSLYIYEKEDAQIYFVISSLKSSNKYNAKTLEYVENFLKGFDAKKLEKLAEVPGFDKVVEDMATYGKKFAGGKFQLEYFAKIIDNLKGSLRFEVPQSIIDATGKEVARVYDAIVEYGGKITKYEMKNWAKWYPSTIKNQFIKDLQSIKNLDELKWVFNTTSGVTKANLKSKIISTLRKADGKPIEELERLFKNEDIVKKLKNIF